MKRIDHDNWLRADAGSRGECMDADRWREALLAVRLSPVIPGDVVLMFEAARGSMLYGYFFRPLLAMGVEQCYRVMETGVRMRCLQAGLPVSCSDSQGKPHPLSFAHNLRALHRLGLIAEADLSFWRQAPALRDWVTAPEHRDALGMEHGQTALTRAAGLLDNLFRA